MDPERTEEDNFDYIFIFRKWGELWDAEIAEGDKVPMGYEQYLELLAEENAEGSISESSGASGSSQSSTPEATNSAGAAVRYQRRYLYMVP